MSKQIRDRIDGIVGIVPTPSTPGSDDWRASDTIAVAESASMAARIVDAGVDVLLTNGTFGEASTLTERELYTFNATVVEAIAGRVPLFAGCTTLNTRDTITRARELVRLGVDGLFLGRPMWLPLDEAQIVTYYRSIAEALGDVPIVVYDNELAFKGAIPARAYEQLAEIPQIVGSKHTGIVSDRMAYTEAMAAIGGRFPLLPMLTQWVRTTEAFPGRVPAAWCGDVAAGPEPAIALRDALASGNADRIAEVDADIRWASETKFPEDGFEAFMQYSIQINREEFREAGFITPGPSRPPYIGAPVNYLEGGAEDGRRWRSLREKYGATITAPVS
nr:dihydrodipicolinate synthase family protein [Microbacterium bovistercoris]